MIIICALAQNRGIGRNNQLLWNLPEDMKFFRETTLGHTVVMGRKTFESIGRPLPQRQNIILTRQPRYNAQGCTVVRTPQEVQSLGGTVYIIGGAEIYSLFMPLAHTMLLTHVHGTWDADTYFPQWNASEWQINSERAGAGNYTFKEYRRIT